MDLCGRIEFTAGWKKPCPPHPHGEGPVLQFSKGSVSHPLSHGLDGQTQAGILPGTHLVRGIEALKDLIEASQEGLFRTFVPKGVSIEAFSAEYILAAADELNGRPRKKLGYRTPEELFDEFLDSVYAAEGCGSIAQDGSQRLPS